MSRKESDDSEDFLHEIIDTAKQDESDDKESKRFAEKTNKFQTRFALDASLNRPIFKIYSDYFNILKENVEMQKAHGIEVLGMIRDNEFRDNMNLYDNVGDKNILLKYKDLVVNCFFSVYKQQNELQFYFYMSSSDKTYIDADFFYDKIWAHAVDASDLKGSYFVMERDEILWTKKPLEKRSFEDIFLPKSIIEDLKLFVAANEQTGVLMRYLMAGNPGTGKTESTLVVANELHKLGVTIIKTPVCQMIKDKVELAELLAPSLIILDDIDLSLGSRNKGVYSERLQDFLDVLDGTDKLNDKVGFIATTNSIALLDLAAQRPGRFDKVLTFDDLTSDNIKNIILKSLKNNYKIAADSSTAKTFTDPKIIELFKNSRVTGAHIYNSVKMLKLRTNLLDKGVDKGVDVILVELQKEIKTIEKTRQADFLTDKLSGGSSNKSIGFDNNNSEDEDDDEDEELSETGLFGH